MDEFQHFAHNCYSTLSKITFKGICNLCRKVTSISFSCMSCKFDLCGTCSKLSPTLDHTLHPQHPLEFCPQQPQQKPSSFICSGCGFISSGSYYQCKHCEFIKIDLECVAKEISEPWDNGTVRHYSHRHELGRCIPGFIGTCLICEHEFSDTIVCYGCVHCLYFIHERCMNLPREIRHPAHPLHPLRRPYYAQHRERKKECRACRRKISGIPFCCCAGCDFSIHTGCADSFLRSLKHESHPHRLFYVASPAGDKFSENGFCKICKKDELIITNRSIYHCMECGSEFHFDCLRIPGLLVSKSLHLHPLWCKRLTDDSSEFYCDVCEAVMHSGNHAYYCKGCDFHAHIECILNKQEHAPLYLKFLYSRDENVMRSKKGMDGATSSESKEENKLLVMVKDVLHTHILGSEAQYYELLCTIRGKSLKAYIDFLHNLRRGSDEAYSDIRHTHLVVSQKARENAIRIYLQIPEDRYSDALRSRILGLEEAYGHGHGKVCSMCDRTIDHGEAYICSYSVYPLNQSQICTFVAHKICAEWGRRRSKNRFHQNHPLTLLPEPPIQGMQCDHCKRSIGGFNFFCRRCDYAVDFRCATQDSMLVQVNIGTGMSRCMRGHRLDRFPKMSISGVTECNICEEDVEELEWPLCGECKEIYHHRCIELSRRPVRFSFHPHLLHLQVPRSLQEQSRDECFCFRCDRVILPRQYWYHCWDCNSKFHVRCPKQRSLEISLKVESHEHGLKHHQACIEDPHDDDDDDDDGSLKRSLECGFCRRTCSNNEGFYGCDECEFVSHVKCLLPMHVNKEEKHEHTLTLKPILTDEEITSKCRSCSSPFKPKSPAYFCDQCIGYVFHVECLLNRARRLTQNRITRVLRGEGGALYLRIEEGPAEYIQ